MSLSADLRFLPCMSTDLENMLEMYCGVLLLIALYIITQELYFTRSGNGNNFNSINMLLELVVKSVFKTMRAARFCNLKILYKFVAEQRPRLSNRNLKWVDYKNCNIGLILFGLRILIVTLRDCFFWRHLNTQNLLVYPSLRYYLYRYLRVLGYARFQSFHYLSIYGFPHCEIYYMSSLVALRKF